MSADAPPPTGVIHRFALFIEALKRADGSDRRHSRPAGRTLAPLAPAAVELSRAHAAASRRAARALRGRDARRRAAPARHLAPGRRPAGISAPTPAHSARAGVAAVLSGVFRLPAAGAGGRSRDAGPAGRLAASRAAAAAALAQAHHRSAARGAALAAASRPGREPSRGLAASEAASAAPAKRPAPHAARTPAWWRPAAAGRAAAFPAPLAAPAFSDLTPHRSRTSYMLRISN